MSTEQISEEQSLIQQYLRMSLCWGGRGARRTDSGPAHSKSLSLWHFHSRRPSERRRERILPSGRRVPHSRPGVRMRPQRGHVTQAAVAADETILRRVVARCGVYSRCAFCRLF